MKLQVYQVMMIVLLVLTVLILLVALILVCVRNGAKISGVAHIFVICDERYEPERHAALQKWLSSTFPSNYYSFDLHCWGSTVTKEDMQRYGVSGRQSRSEASLIVNHLKILEKFCRHYGTNDRILVLESDVIPVNGWLDTLSVQLAKLEKTTDWDFFQIGNGCGHKPKQAEYITTNEPEVYLCPATRCADSIIWSRRGAEAVLRCKNI